MIAITTNSSTRVNAGRFAGKSAPCLGDVPVMINVAKQNNFEDVCANVTILDGAIHKSEPNLLRIPEQPPGGVGRRRHCVH